MNKRAYVRFGENYHGIHIRESSEEFGALFRGNEWAAFTFECADRFIRIDRHHEPASQRFGGTQVADVANVKKVETSIGEDDRIAGALPRPSLFQQCRAVEDFGWRHGVQCSRITGVDCVTACSNSCCDTVAVPRFITTSPPAQLARCAASWASAPAAKAAVKVAITVSPAPVTSATWSEPEIGMSAGLCSWENAVMPSRPRVMTKD